MSNPLTPGVPAALLLAALLLAGACSTAAPPPAQPSRGLQPSQQDEAARAAYVRYQRWYAQRKQELRQEAWDAVQRRAAQQQAELDRQQALREAYTQQRWQSYR